jgi:hypothetical protein
MLADYDRIRRPGIGWILNKYSIEHFFVDEAAIDDDFVAMNATMNRKPRWCWRKDLAEFRGLTDRERAGFLLVLEWFENFRLRHELEAGREAAKAFWKSDVKREGREREKWQLEQWARLRCATPWHA